MGKKSSPELTLSVLLTAALCLGAKIEFIPHLPNKSLNWTNARQYCQREHIDFLTLTVVDMTSVTKVMVDAQVKSAWMGLHRDLEQLSVWKWANLETGIGISGNDLSQSSYWADLQQSSECAYVGYNLLLFSAPCLKLYPFYCSQGDQIKRYGFLKSWHDASQYCQEQGGYLATISDYNVNNVYTYGWIGLYRETEKNWSWVGNLSSSYRNWAPNHPLVEDCGFIYYPLNVWHSEACHTALPFLCYDDNLVVVNENKTWEDALKHCKELERPCVRDNGPCVKNYDLLSLTDPSDFSHVRERINRVTSTAEVWTGLRLLGGEWWWSNGQALSQQTTLPDCPPQGKACGALSRGGTNDLDIRDCAEKINFICSGKVEQ